ncbi:unnamed protein product [Chrysoparadoxa australica]
MSPSKKVTADVLSLLDAFRPSARSPDVVVEQQPPASEPEEIARSPATSPLKTTQESSSPFGDDGPDSDDSMAGSLWTNLLKPTKQKPQAKPRLPIADSQAKPRQPVPDACIDAGVSESKGGWMSSAKAGADGERMSENGQAKGETGSGHKGRAQDHVSECMTSESSHRSRPLLASALKKHPASAAAAEPKLTFSSDESASEAGIDDDEGDDMSAAKPEWSSARDAKARTLKTILINKLQNKRNNFPLADDLKMGRKSLRSVALQAHKEGWLGTANTEAKKAAMSLFPNDFKSGMTKRSPKRPRNDEWSGLGKGKPSKRSLTPVEAMDVGGSSNERAKGVSSEGSGRAEVKADAKGKDKAKAKETREEWELSDGEFGSDYKFLDSVELALQPTLANPQWLQEGEPQPYPLGTCDGREYFIPAAINRYLKEYQREGVQFMWDRYSRGEGSILADDMGLGKTVQIIALLAAVLGKTGTPKDIEELKQRKRDPNALLPPCAPVLIAVPSATAEGWTNHLKDWGHFEHKHLACGKDIDSLLDGLGKLEVVVMSHDLLGQNRGRLTSKNVKWGLLVVDEFHKAMTQRTRLAQACSQLRPHIRSLIGLTGTPLQNKMQELWWLMQLAKPGCLGTKERFKEYFAVPIKRGLQCGASEYAKAKGKERQQELDDIIKKCMLQRFKREVLVDDLPSKSQFVVFCPLSKVQRRLYKHILSLPDFQGCARATDPCDCGREDVRGKCCYKIPMSDGDIDPRAVIWLEQHEEREECRKCPTCVGLPCLSKLQKVANHPMLLQTNSEDRDNARQEKVKRFAEVALPGGPGSLRDKMGGLERPYNFEMASTEHSGKLQTLHKMLQKFYQENRRLLLFSLSVMMLDILEMYCKAKGYTYLRLDGSTPGAQRQTMVNKYNDKDSNIFIFLISTKAGGLGLNLPRANRVIIYDVHWNPTNDAQAQDRAYRIGQMEDVEVFTLVSEGTVEEMTYLRQLYKTQIASAAMSGEGGRRQFVGVQDSKGEEGELFGFKNLFIYSECRIVDQIRRQYQQGKRGAPATVEGKEDEFQGLQADRCGLVTANRGELLTMMEQADEGDQADGLAGMLGVKTYLQKDLISRDQDDTDDHLKDTSFYEEEARRRSMMEVEDDQEVLGASSLSSRVARSSDRCTSSRMSRRSSSGLPIVGSSRAPARPVNAPNELNIIEDGEAPPPAAPVSPACLPPPMYLLHDAARPPSSSS